MTTSKLSDIDFFALEEVALHSKPVAEDGVPVAKATAIRLVADGLATLKACSYLKHLKKPERYTGIELTSKGRRVASETDERAFKVVEVNVDALLKSMEAREAKKGA